jgi:hypothetical protein
LRLLVCFGEGSTKDAAAGDDHLGDESVRHGDVWRLATGWERAMAMARGDDLYGMRIVLDVLRSK